MVDRTTELKSRVQARRSELEARLKQLRADTQGAVNDEMENLETRLSRLDDILKDGWERISQETVHRLNEWLK
jgi:hypothetical protein